MQPSLEGAQHWLDRAEEHLHDLDVLVAIMFEIEREAVLVTAHVGPDREDGVGEFGYNAAQKITPPLRISVLLGETIQALRRALDYLVYEIAFLDSGTVQDDTQFPMDHSQKRFWARLNRNRRGQGDHSCYLIGVLPKHATVIERYQPYQGVEWTTSLARLANPDKHRRLTAVRHMSKSAPTYGSPTDRDIAKTPEASAWSCG